MAVEATSGSSEDSWRSLSASDVLIRSTSFHMKKKPVDSQTAASTDCKPAACMKQRICIPAKKLREVTPPCRPESFVSTKDGRVHIPPALLANRPAAQKLSTVTDEEGNEGAESRPVCGPSEQLPSPEKEIQLSQLSSKARPARVVLQGNEDAGKQKAADMFISQYDTGQKEAVRAVFKQRIQNLPVFKEVKVQLLDSGCPEKTDSARTTHNDVDSASTIAAATAAAIASTAPFLKVQSELEAKVSSVSEILKKLQETDRQLQRLAKQQASLKSQAPERPPCHRRIEELEKQIGLFMEQRIQHLEKLQQQQMNLQSHLISSALNSGGFQGVRTAPFTGTAKHAAGELLANPGSVRQWDIPSSSAVPVQTYSQQFENHGIHRQKSPLKTPAPRRFAPVPVSKDAKIAQKISKRENSVGEKENIHQSSYGGTLGGGRLLEQILNDQEIPFAVSPQNEPMKNGVRPGSLGRECRSNGLKPAPFPAFKSTVQNLNPIERTAKKADEVLHDLGQLKREMHDILKDAKEWKSDMNSSKKTVPRYSETIHGNDHFSSHQPAHSLRPSSEVLHVSSPSKHKDPLAPSLSELQKLSKSSILQSTKASKCILKDAEDILRAVQKNKKLLEENLEAIIRAQDGNALHAFVDELTADRDVLEEIRIRKTVDEWIKIISMEIQEEMAKKDSFKTQPAIKTAKGSQEINEKSSYPRGMPIKRRLPPARTFPKLMDKRPLKIRMGIPNEDHLSHLYGRPMYQAHRSTLKKSPYLRFNSPPPKPKPPRPKLIESVRGTKVKSAKTQTGTSMHSQVISPKKPSPLSAPSQELRYLFSPTKGAPDASGPFEGHLIPMAIPLGKKQIHSIMPQPAGVTTDEFHPITVTTSVPPVPPKIQFKVKKPNIAVIEMKSEKKDPPKLSVQVLPNLDIDSVSSDGTSASQSSLTPLPTKVVLQAAPESSQLLDEDPKLPGVNFVDVAGVSQDEQEDDIPEFSEPVLEFNSRGETMSPKYNGLPFPPAAPAPHPSADILEEIIEKRETLENKLVSWVEQEVMARIISGMFPAKKEAVPNISVSESEDSQVGSSDIVEAAGAEGFQLFVSAGTPVDSEMIRRFVNEALAETVAVMLGDREGQRTASATVVPSAITLMAEKETTIPTPLATPEATPPPTPPPLKELSPAKTPESSPSVTEADGEVGKQQFTAAAESKAIPASPVSTPVATPIATPPRIATPSPPVSVRAPNAGMMAGQTPPNAWEDAELPLEEEKPSPQSEGGEPHPTALILSVGVHEEPDSLVLPAPPQPAESSNLPEVPSVSVHTPSSGPTTEESSLTSTGTETADRPISEGEVLYSYGQLLAAKAVAEGGVSFPNLSDSFTSTLHDVQEMVYDPPSEGQVLQRPLKGFHKDPFLCLFSKLNQVPLASQEEICHSESTDGSAGELSEGQRPKLTKIAESILLGCPPQVDRPASQIVKKPSLQATAPGERDQAAGGGGGEFPVTHGPMSLAELEQTGSQTAHREGDPASHLDEPFQKKYQMVLQTGPVKTRHICVKSKSEVTGQQGFQRDTNQALFEPKPLFSEGEPTRHPSPPLVSAKVSVTVPSASMEDQSFSSIHGISESSGADTF